MLERSSSATRSRRTRSSRIVPRSSSPGDEAHERAVPEDPPDHGRPLEDGLLARRQPVDARGDQRLHACPGSARRRRRRRRRSASGSSPRRTAGCPRSCRGGPSGRPARARPAAAARRRAARSPRRQRLELDRDRRAGGRRPSPAARRAARAGRGRRSGAAPGAPIPTRCSISSNSGSSAQWMSSKTSTSGCASASFVGPLARRPRRSPAGGARRATASRTPDASPSRSAIASSSQQTRSFSIASSSGSSSEIPADALTISASGQYVIALAVGQAAAGEHGRALERLLELLREAALADARARRRS